MAQIKYVDQNGLKKVQQDYVAKIAEAVKDLLKKVTVQGQEATILDGTATVDLTSVLEPYAKKSDLEGLVGHISLKGSCLKEDLATKKTEATVGDIYIVTDDNNHFYLFVGEGENGDENGFIDIGSHTEIQLDDYLKTETADSTYVKIASGVTQLKAQLDAAYLPKEGAAEALQAELDEVYCKVADGYVKTETADQTYLKKEGAVEALQTELDEIYLKTETAETTYQKSAEIIALTDTEIEQALGISA